MRVVDSRSNFRAYGPQMTGASNGIASNWDLMRNAGAAARAMFVEAAAIRWSVPTGAITVRDGIVSHPGSNRAATFVELLADASRQQPQQSPVLKQPADYRLIGTDKVRRKDSLPKSTGAQVYTQDIHRPDMLVAMVAHSPRFGGKLARFDAADARNVKGVVDVFAIETGVAVVAETTFAAWQGRDALRIEWDESEAEKRSTHELVSHYHDIAAGRSDMEPSEFTSKGDDPEVSFDGDVAEFSFDFPYLAHAPMETLDCVAQVKGWDVSITSGAHLATLDQVQAAFAARTAPGKVDVEVVPAGGSFGRRGVMSSDYLVECVWIAKQTDGRPLKLMWSRRTRWHPAISGRCPITVCGFNWVRTGFRRAGASTAFANRFFPWGRTPWRLKGSPIPPISRPLRQSRARSSPRLSRSWSAYGARSVIPIPLW